MEISVSEAKAQLTDLVRRAEAGEDITLTRHGHPVARLTPLVRRKPNAEEKMRVMDAIIREAHIRKARGWDPGGIDHDLLYNEDGLPK